MPIGKAGPPVSHISQAYPDRVEVRGRDLCGDLMGRLSFTEYFHLLLTGEEPTEDQRYFLDLLLVAIAEHGMMPTNVAARMTLAADPGSLQGAVAAGILGCGPVILGTSEACAQLLEEAQEKVAAGGEAAAVAADAARAVHASGGRLPGFGHPVHRPLDPRAERILELADEHGVSGPHVVLARRLRDAVAEAWGKPLTMNVSMPIAAVMLDLGFPSATVKAVPILARTAGLLAHLAEEQQQPIGFLMAGRGGGGDRVRAPAGGRIALILAPEVETRPWADQLAVDDASYSDPARLSLERSAFYRGKLDDGRIRVTRRGRRARRHRAASADGEARDQGHVHSRQPDRGASLRHAGGDRPHLLDERHDRHPELHPAHGGRSRQLDHRIRAQLRGLRRRGGPARGHYLQRRARSWPARRLPRSTASASPTSRSGPGTPSG